MRILAACLLLFPAQSGDPVRLPVIADSQICMAHGEERLNGGGRSTVRLKGIEDLTIIDLDLSGIKGRTVEEARLFFTPAGAHKLRSIGMSTIGSPLEGRRRDRLAGQAGRMHLPRGRPRRAPLGPSGLRLPCRHLQPRRLDLVRARPEERSRRLVLRRASPRDPPRHARGNSYGLALVDETRPPATTASTAASRTRRRPIASSLEAGAAPPPSGAKRTSPAGEEDGRPLGDFLKRPAPAAVAPVALADGTKYRILYEGETNPTRPRRRALERPLDLARRGARGARRLRDRRRAAAARARPHRRRRLDASRVLPVGSTFDPLVPSRRRLGQGALPRRALRAEDHGRPASRSGR
jgi:hypothetical protein